MTHTHTKRWILDYRTECINWTPSDIQKKISSIFPETKVTSCPFFFVLEQLSLLMLCATVYIYTRQLISFRAPMLSFIKLTVATCHMQFKPFWDYVSLFYKKMDKIGKYLKSTIFLWYKNGREREQKKLSNPDPLLRNYTGHCILFTLTASAAFLNHLNAVLLSCFTTALPSEYIWKCNIEFPVLLKASLCHNRECSYRNLFTFSVCLWEVKYPHLSAQEHSDNPRQKKDQ